MSTESLWYYSQLAIAINLMPAKISGSSGSEVKSWLLANKGKLGVKDDEIQWSGVADWLELRGKEKTSKADVAEYLAGNGVSVEEVVLGDSKTTKMRWSKWSGRDEYGDRFIDSIDLSRERNEWRIVEGSDGEFTIYDNGGEQAGGTVIGLDRAKELAAEYAAGGTQKDVPKFAGYVPSGGKPGTYRELLLTLPDKDKGFDWWYLNIHRPEAVREMGGDENMVFDTLEGYDSDAKEYLGEMYNKWADNNGGKNTFVSSHYPDHKNILAHLRVDEVEGANGERLLRVVEMQSDWGQRGRKDGFDAGGIAYEIHVPGSRFHDVATNRADAEAMAAEHDGTIVEKKTEFKGIPSAPFVTDTQAWLSLAIKKAISYASEHGLDGIVFATGQQNADLYDLSKQVKSVEATRQDDGNYYLIANFVDKKSEYFKSVKESDLENIIGKDLAEKIAKQGDGDVEYSGVDLKVGGDGMRKFYDSIVPQVASKVLKQIGGDNVGYVQLDTGKKGHVWQSQSGWSVRDETGQSEAARFDNEVDAIKFADEMKFKQQPGFMLTDAIRKKVSQGLPLFQGDRGLFDPESLTIRLLDNADLSTFIHESGHFYLEVMTDLAGQAGTPVIVREDLKAVVGWMGVPGGVDAWHSMSLDDKRPFHELFARGFEAYLMTEKAPAPELGGLFARAKGWLTGIYRDLTRLDVKLSPEVTRVFDRLVLSADLEEVGAESVREGLLSQLEEIDRFTDEVNLTYATLVAGFYASQAKAVGVTPGEMVERFPLSIRSDVHGLVPEGIGRRVTDSREFKEWFGDSKVVGEDGRLLVVYHGTVSDADFTEFMPMFNSLGSHFGTKTQANSFADFKQSIDDSQEPGARVLPVYLSIQNPIRLIDPGTGNWANDSIGSQLFEVGIIDEELLENSDSLCSETYGENLQFALQKAGFDGIVYLNRREGNFDAELAAELNYLSDVEFKTRFPDAEDSWVVFEPSQIKSVFNRGTFELADHNILHQSAFELNGIASAIKSTYKSKQLWPLLLDESLAQSGPFDGGCLICAKALIRANGGGELVRIVSDIDGGQTEHYGVRLDDGIYDFAGKHASAEDWIKKFERLEKTGRNLSFSVGHDPESEIPDDPVIEKKVARLLVEEGARMALDISRKVWNGMPEEDRDLMVAAGCFKGGGVLASAPLPAEIEVVSGGSYVGSIVDVRADYVIQHVGRGVNVAHARDGFGDLMVVGMKVCVDYKVGGVVVSGVGGRGVER